MFSDTTMRPRSRTFRTAASISPPISAPASTRTRALGSRDAERTASASVDSPTSGIVSTEMRSPPKVVPIRLRDGAHRDLPDLRSPAHDDHALPEDPPVRLFLGDVDHRGERLELLDHGSQRPEALDLEEDAVDGPVAAQDHDPGDIPPEARDHPAQLMEHARPALRPDEEAECGIPRIRAFRGHGRHSASSATRSILSSSSGTMQRNSKGSLPSVRYQ